MSKNSYGYAYQSNYYENNEKTSIIKRTFQKKNKV